MFLSKPETVKMLNSYFIPCFVDFVNTAPGSRRWYLALRARLFERRREFNYRGGPQLWVVSPEGEPMAAFHVEDVQLFKDQVESTLARLVQRLGKPPGPPLARYVPRALSGMARDDIALHITSRFLLDDTLASLEPRVKASLDYDVPPIPAAPPPPSTLFRIRVKSPIDEWCVLNRAQEEALLPPAGARPGDAYAVPAEAASPIFRHMCPPTTNFNLAGEVLEAELNGRVAVSGSEIRVQLSGRYGCQHQLWHARDKNVAEATVNGFLVFDATTRHLTRFGLVTDLGVYGDHKGLRIPYTASAELWTGTRGSLASRAPLPAQLPADDVRSREYPEQEGGPSALQGRQFAPPATAPASPDGGR
ncbi:MAG: hypothetical protein EB084_11575 [Proteobacteria bacterium]|nr:hypothetical protein [Pseudomonadota bacterium]